jgi:two-component system OmpR family sensor kinase
MFASIRGRLWLSYAALITTALLVVGAVLLVFLLRNPTTYRQTYARLRAAEAALGSRAVSAARLDAVGAAFGVRLLHFDLDGTLLEDTDPGATALRLPSGRLGLQALAAARDVGGRPWLYSKTRLADGSWLIAAAPRPRLLPAIGVLTDELSRPLLQSGLIALLLSLVLAYVLARWIGDPIQALVGTAHAVSTSGNRGGGVSSDTRAAPASGNGFRLPAERGPQEIRELTRAFNAMVKRVSASQQAQREFVANVSHELKTPLTSIQGFAQALLDGTASSDGAKRKAAMVIQAEADVMHRMVLDLLELARFDAGTPELRFELVDPADILTRVADRFRPTTLEKGVELTVAVQRPLAEVQADGDRLGQVFSNILDNALKHTPAGGRVEIRGGVNGGQIEIRFLDSGPGIAASDQPHVFERFFQADTARGGGDGHGAGLGLAIAKEIIEAHGGRISLRSGAGQGAEFTVSLPIADRPRG